MTFVFPILQMLHRSIQRVTNYPIKSVINTGLATLAAEHRLKRLGRKKPIHDLRPGRAKRMLKRLIRPSGKTVKRNSESLYNYSCHKIYNL